MPGINSLITYKPRDPVEDEKIDNVAVKMRYLPSYFTDILLKDEQILTLFSGYEFYPHTTLRSGDLYILIDGAIYNKPSEQLSEELSKITAVLADKNDYDIIRRFMLDTDGEYLIYLIDLSHSRFIAFNDSLGRMPLFYYHDSQKTILARDYKFATAILSNVEINRDALPGYFTFLAPLGTGTLLKGIDRLSPATVAIINFKSGTFEQRILLDHNFDERLDDQDLKYYASYLKKTFLKATSNRLAYFHDRKHLLALSGGLDSRAVLLSLIQSNANLETVTFKYRQDISNRDLPVVNRLVTLYGLRHHQFDLPENDISCMEKLILMKDGLGLNLIMGFVLQSLEQLLQNFGPNTVYFTGDGGGYIVGPRYIGKQIASMDEFLNLLISRNSILAEDDVCALLGINKNAYRDKLAEHFSGYPEKDYIHKYDRYFFFEHLLRFSMEGEDRVRYFLWSTTPLYSNEFTNYAFKIKNKYLANWDIYREFLRQLDPNSIKIPYANWGLRIDSPLLPLYLRIRNLALRNAALKSRLIKILRLIKNPSTYKSKLASDSFALQLRRYLENLAKNTGSAGKYIDIDFLLKLSASETSSSKLYIFINLLKYINSLASDKSLTED